MTEVAEQKRRARFVLRSMLYFWPMVDSADDVDRVTRFGYRVCIWALLLSAIPLAPELVNLNWIAWATLAVSAVLYFFGANAVRQESTVAAATLCFMIATDIPYSYLFRHAFGCRLADT